MAKMISILKDVPKELRTEMSPFLKKFRPEVRKVLLIICQSNRGKIVIINAISAVKLNHVKADLISSLIEETILRLRSEKIIIDFIEKYQHYLPLKIFEAKLDKIVERIINLMTYVIRYNQHKYQFIHKNYTIPDHVQEVSTLISARDFIAFYLSSNAKVPKVADGRMKDTDAEDLKKIINDLSGKPESFRKGVFYGNGNDQFFWFTFSTDLGETVDRVRDKLGLVHRGRKDFLIELKLPVKNLVESDIAIPNFLEAGSHRRFKSLTCEDFFSGYGLTADLEKLAINAHIIDGAPELVHGPLPFRKDMGWEWQALGYPNKHPENIDPTNRQARIKADGKFAQILTDKLKSKLSC
jgi:hypothetical protein